MKNIYNTLFIQLAWLYIVIAFLLTSCYKEINNSNVDCSTYNYSDCNTIEPQNGRIYIKLTINSENQSVPITIYSGKFENNNVFLVDTVTAESYDTLLPIGYYSVVAKYIKGNSTVIAIDGAKTSKSKTVTCDSTCWTVTSGKVNVQLK